MLSPDQVMARARAISSNPLAAEPLAALLREVDPAEPYFATRAEAWGGIVVRAVATMEALSAGPMPGVSPAVQAAVRAFVADCAAEADRAMELLEGGSLDASFGTGGMAHAAVAFYRLAAAIARGLGMVRSQLGSNTPAALLEVGVEIEAIVGTQAEPAVADTARPARQGSDQVRAPGLSPRMRRNGLMILGALALVTLLGNTRD